MMNVGFVHLGCSKNLIDTEAAIGEFKKHKYRIVNDESQAEVLVINTCGFIETAKEEAINTILEMIKYKENKCKYMIVMGCLVQRYYDDLVKSLPEVDLFLKLDQYNNMWETISNLIERDIVEIQEHNYTDKISEVQVMPMLDQEEYLGRTITTGTNFAYLKIAEGCSKNCTYCAIPYIRGPFVSRKMEDILAEAKHLAEIGIKEIIIIAQDTTKYGIDIYGESKLVEVVRKISKIEGIKWVRFMYSYPEDVTDELIEETAQNPKIAKYFDIPVQHISNNILKKMNRHTTKEVIIGNITKIRNKIPNVVLRTSLIVGFPGETEQDFEELVEFIKFAKFDKLGVFKYSKEEGTPAAKMKEQVHGNTKKSRYHKLMLVQKDISKNNLKRNLNKEMEILVEQLSFDKKYYIGRTMQDAPDIDGIVYIKNNCEENILNKFVKVKIIDVKEYDYIAEIS